MKKHRFRRKLRRFLKRLPGTLLELFNPVELLGEIIGEPEVGLPLLILAGVAVTAVLVTAAFFGIISDAWDRTPLQTLGLK